MQLTSPLDSLRPPHPPGAEPAASHRSIAAQIRPPDRGHARCLGLRYHAVSAHARCGAPPDAYIESLREGSPGAWATGLTTEVHVEEPDTLPARRQHRRHLRRCESAAVAGRAAAQARRLGAAQALPDSLGKRRCSCRRHPCRSEPALLALQRSGPGTPLARGRRRPSLSACAAIPADNLNLTAGYGLGQGSRSRRSDGACSYWSRSKWST